MNYLSIKNKIKNMNFKEPVIYDGGKYSVEELISLRIVAKKNHNTAEAFLVNKSFYKNRKVEKIAFSIEENKVVIVINPSEDIPSYGLKKQGGSNIICNKNLCEDIIKALNIELKPGTVYFKPIPITKFRTFETFELQLIK
jgi:hypothetical protein